MRTKFPEPSAFSILENVPAIIVIHDKEQKLLWVNKVYLEVTGSDWGRIAGRMCWDDWGLARRCDGCPVTVTLETGEEAEAEMTLGSHLLKSQDCWLVKAVPFRDEEGHIIGAIETAFKIGDRKRVEQSRLLEEKRKFQAISEYAQDAIILMDDEGKVKYSNPATQKMFGYSTSELMGKDVHAMLMPDEYRGRFEKGFEAFRKTGKGPGVGKVLELTSRHRSGATIPIEISISPIQIKGKFWAGGIIRNIVEKKRNEKKITQQLKILSVLFETAGKLTESFDFNAEVKEVVRTAVEVFGCSLAWLGYAKEDGSVPLLAHYPEHISYPKEIMVRWDETPEGQGPAGRSIQSGTLQITEDISSDPRFKPWVDKASETGIIKSVVAFPLISRDRTFGALTVYSDQQGYFTPERLKYLQSFVHLSASALVNAQLYEESKRRLGRISALRNIDMAIAGTLDLRVVYRVSLDEIVNHLEIDAACILRLNPHTQILEFRAGRGFRTNKIKESLVPLGEGAAGRIASEREVVHLSDLSQVDRKMFTRQNLLAGERFVSYYGAPLVAKGEFLGVLEIFHRSFHDRDEEWLNFLETLAGQVAIAIDNAGLVDDLRHRHMELIKAYDETIVGWGTALSLKEEETEEHSQRVTHMTFEMARRMGVSEEELTHMRRGALLHDIGKIGVPDSILLKPGKLTDEEWKIMRKHPIYAFEMLAPIAYLSKSIDIPYCHHEKWVGGGYPRGLKGKQIPLSARIFALVDVWDALTSDRPYRKAWPRKKVIAYIKERSGTEFDPEVAQCFLEYINES